MKFMPSMILSLSCLLAGCGGGSSSPEDPTQVTPPAPNNPAQGTILEESCNGTTLVQSVADGNGGSTQQETPNSEQCGYVAPPSEGTVLDEYCEDPHTLVTVTADGNGGEVESRQEESEQCGYEPPPEFGTPVGESYCGRELASSAADRFQELLNTINNVRYDDRFQDYADGEGGTYTEREVQLDQTCFTQMEAPPDCPTTASSTGDPRYGYITCDGIKQRTDVSFPYNVDDPQTGWAIIDMLIVVDTNLSEEERGGMTVDEFVDKQIFEANHIYDISNTGIRLRVADIVMIDVAVGDLYRQYSAFFNGRYEFNGLDDWQRNAGADLAFLFKSRHSDPIACGVASLDATRGLTKTRGITQCYHNSVFQEAANTRYYERAQETFAHEVGHLLGLSHQWEDADQPGLFEYSYGYNVPGYNPQSGNPDYEGIHGGYGTVMSYADLATARFSDRDAYIEIPETGQSKRLGTDGGCFCLDPIENQPPPTDNVDTLRRTRFLMSQLHELEHGVQFSTAPNKFEVDDDDPVWMIWTNKPEDICLF